MHRMYVNVSIHMVDLMRHNTRDNTTTHLRQYITAAHTTAAQTTYEHL